ncbi:hypothetical protein NDU88_003972 [Pleurodeles waltl]|uniref:Secreted protein n=1 Tax=Pleurodeles waltl TaxID=8319 RepID=A0AAV7NLE0_PLEWA|nr:hypothetical protein NDU88_003972 [Pleurodeles waltl]
MIHSRAFSWIPMLLRRCTRVRWQTVSNAAERSRRMRAAVSPLSTRARMSSVAAMRAVSVLWLARKPDCEWSRDPLVSRKAASCLLTVFSMTLAGNGRSEMGR